MFENLAMEKGGFVQVQVIVQVFFFPLRSTARRGFLGVLPEGESYTLRRADRADIHSRHREGLGTGNRDTEVRMDTELPVSPQKGKDAIPMTQ